MFLLPGKEETRMFLLGEEQGLTIAYYLIIPEEDSMDSNFKPPQTPKFFRDLCKVPVQNESGIVILF